MITSSTSWPLKMQTEQITAGSREALKLAWERSMTVAVDLDGTLAEYHGWTDDGSVGRPVSRMVGRVKQWLAEGKSVVILTARVCHGDPHGQEPIVRAWLNDTFGREVAEQIKITSEKDWSMVEIWDDRAVQVIMNTGERADGKA